MKYLFVISVLVWSIGCVGGGRPAASPIIPQPAQIDFLSGKFTISASTALQTNLEIDKEQWLRASLACLPLDSSRFNANDISGNRIDLILDTENNIQKPGSYRLEIDDLFVRIEASDRSGLFYGIQSLIQLYNEYGAVLPAMTINDYPRFGYRGLLLDCTKRFFTPEFIKKQIDLLAYYKINRLVLYLGGDGGWRMDIPGYPQLTEQASMRTIEDYTAWKESGSRYAALMDQDAYGGSYTEQQLKDLVAYAHRHFIEITPAFDIPCGSASLSKSLEGGICMGSIYSNDSVLPDALEKIIEYICETFSPEYIYVGNGAADQQRGVFCPTCAPRVGAASPTSEAEPNAITLRRVEEMLDRRGVGLLTYEETLRAGISDNASIVCWHDERDGEAVAATGRSVVLAPASFFSLDYYQNDPMAHPESMTGYLPIDKVYGFLASSAGRSHEEDVLGVQASLWSGFIGSSEQTEFMLWPRMMAVAEVGWSVPSRKSFLDFRRRVAGASEILLAKGYNISDIRTWQTERPESLKNTGSIAVGKPVAYKTIFDRSYPASGKQALTDGQLGSWAYDDGRWQGFLRTDIDVVVDLEQVTPITGVSATFMQDYASKIFMPLRVEISISSDGEQFHELAVIENELPSDKRGYFLAPFGWKGSAEARYVRYVARSCDRPGSWLFTDEIVVK